MRPPRPSASCRSSRAERRASSRSDDAFKALLHTAPPGKRDYYGSIRQAIQKHRRQKDISRFWLFSLREDRSVLMSFFDTSLSS